MADYGYKPYNGNNAPEYNAVGDTGNGRIGSYSPGAMRNRLSQPGGGPRGNPYAEILNHVRAVNAPQPVRPVGTSALLRGDVPSGDGGSTLPPAGGPTTYPTGGNPYSGPGTQTKPGLTKTTGLPDTPTNNNPVITQGNPQPTGPVKPPNVDDQTWADAQRYAAAAKAQGHNYDFLLQHPEWITEFRNWALNTPGGTNVDITDWLKAMHPGEYSGLAGRSSTGDTYSNWQANQQKYPQTQTPGGDSGMPQFNPTQFPQAMGLSELEKLLHQYLDPSYRQGQNDLSAQMRGQAALTGDSNAGGFGEVFGRNQGRLIADQNADFGNKLMTAREHGLKNALEQYKIASGENANVFGTRMGGYLGNQSNELGRERIGLERELGNQNYNLGLGSLGLDQYKWDNPSINQLLMAYLGMSPEQMALQGMGGINWPNWIASRPVQTQP